MTGFTGTRQGMTDRQLAALRELIHNHDLIELHHGDCVGADAQAHEIAMEDCKDVVIHPPSDPKARAYCTNTRRLPRVTFLAEKHYLDRNLDIVTDTSLLIAAPLSLNEQSGGTWGTIRMAREKGKPVIILDP